MVYELTDQGLFEERWNWDKTSSIPSGVREVDGCFLVYFTAAWCAPCKALDLAAIDAVATMYNLPVWKCDATMNDYTAGYCNVRSFPTFLVIQPKKILHTIKSNQTADVCSWIHQIHSKN